MADRLQDALKHRFIYVPRGTQKDTLALGKLLGLAVARERGARLTVLSAQKGGATHHSELAKQTIVTERSGSVPDGGVVLAWCPRPKTMEKLHHLESSTIVLVEWIPGEMAAWARLNEAYNVVTGEVMRAGLTDEALAALAGIVDEGYKGWTDDISERIVGGYLKDLVALGEYDRDLIVAFARQTKHETSVARLVKILDKHEAAGARRRWEL